MNNQLNWKLLGLTGMMMLWPLFGAAQVNLDSGLIAYWPFNGNADDESGNNFDGTVFGATLTSDRFGANASAYRFDGIDDYISVPSDSTFNGPDSFSIAVWFNSDLTATRTKIITKGTNVGSNRSLYTWELTVNPQNSTNIFLGQVRGGYSDGASPAPMYSRDTTLFDAWNFVLMTYDGVMGKWYVNGILQDSTVSISGTLNGEPGPINIGRDNNSDFGEDEFSGKIDDVRIYNRALNPQEIDSLYNENLNATNVFEFNYLNISLFPNPAPGAFALSSPQAAIESVTLYDLTGRRLPAEISHDRHEAQVRSSYRGLVIVKVQTDQGMWVQKALLDKK